MTMRNLQLSDMEWRALRPALDNEIETWSGADCGEKTEENETWVNMLKVIREKMG